MNAACAATFAALAKAEAAALTAPCIEFNPAAKPSPADCPAEYMESYKPETALTIPSAPASAAATA